MKRLLLLFTSSFPFSGTEPYVAAEFPALEAAFDEVVLISNDTSSPRNWPTGPSVSCQRISYGLSLFEKFGALQGLFQPLVWADVAAIRKRHPHEAIPRVLSTVLTSWAKANKFARMIREVAARYPGREVFGYSYWGNDMAIAVALARKLGTVRRAVSRFHGWDVYTSRPEVGFLPFRGFLADNLDSLIFVSADGLKFFESSVGRGRGTLDVLPIGTRRESDGPLKRGEALTVVSCSELIPLKRVDLLAKALGQVDRPIRWVHLGDGPERSRVEAVCAKLPATVETMLAGNVSHEQVIETWRKLRPLALVNVSRTEGVPVSMMEAMSLGIPVIGTGVGGVPEIVEDGVNGYLLPADPAPHEVAAAIVAVADLSQAAFESLAHAAWQTWHDRFRAEKNFGRLVEHLLGASASKNVGLSALPGQLAP